MALTDRDKLILAVSQMVKAVHGGDWKAAFKVYDKDRDGLISADELNDVLLHSGVGNFLTRGAFVRGVMREVDSDENGLISFSELMAVFQPTPVSES